MMVIIMITMIINYVKNMYVYDKDKDYYILYISNLFLLN